MSFGRTTLVGSPLVAAPGKIFLIGEYAVLEEGNAVVAAVTRHAVGQYLPRFDHASPLIREAVERAIAGLGELGAAMPTGSVLVDSKGFEENGQKLGLGSSAAAAVSAVGAVFEYVGRSVADYRDLVHSIADAAHRATQGGRGSGADVATAVHGGYIHFFKPRDGLPAVTPLKEPANLEIVVFWTGRSASTPQLIEAVQAFGQRTPPLYQWAMDELRSLASRFLQEFTTGHPRGVIETVAGYQESLRELGSSAGVEIVTPAFDAVSKVARSLGGASKPSGAGGGDVGIAVFGDPDAAQRFRKQCPAGVSVLDVRVETRGVHRRLPGSA